MSECRAPGAPRYLGGKYELIRELGRGGMASVHLARIRGLGGFERIVVIKRLLPHLAGEPLAGQMFLDEARIAASLHHQNLIQVLDVGMDDGEIYLAMEFLHGHDLATLLDHTWRRDRPIPRRHAFAILAGICAGLHYAHEKKDDAGAPLGIVHRDISPRNVFLTYDGGVKVIDFGLAKSERRVAETLGLVKGTPSYMAPEQCAGATLDRRSDIYAISVLAFELTTGHLPHQGKGIELFRRVREEEPTRPSVLRPDYPPALEQIVLRGLARETGARYQSAAELGAALEEFAACDGGLSTQPELARYFSEEFSADAEAWRAAQRSGRLADHSVGVALRRAAERRPPRGEAGELSQSLEPWTRLDRARRRPRRPSWPRLAAALVAIAGAVVGFLAFGGGSDADESQAGARPPVSAIERRERSARGEIADPAAAASKERAENVSEEQSKPDSVDAPPLDSEPAEEKPRVGKRSLRRSRTARPPRRVESAELPSRTVEDEMDAPLPR